MFSDPASDCCTIRVTFIFRGKKTEVQEELMKRAKAITFLLLLVAIVALACPGTMDCPIHSGWVANYTGTRMVDGVLVGVYHCPFGSVDHPRGHDFITRCN
jgi:hypothetical protein